MVQDTSGRWGSAEGTNIEVADVACRAMNYVGAEAVMRLTINSTIQQQYYRKYITII